MRQFEERTANPLILVGFLVILLLVFPATASAASTITGFVFDKQGNVLPDVDVELLDEYYRVVMVPNGRTKTDSAGRYSYTGLNNGFYTVRVFPFKYDFEDDQRTVQVDSQNVRGGEGSGYFNVDFFLKPKRGGLADAELSVVFAQDVPDAAKTHYKLALKELGKGRKQEGLTELYEAIKVFPDYYLALQRLGTELFMIKQFKESIPYLLKASDLNPKSPTTFYYLGYALHSLGKAYNKSALTALSEAAVLAPASVQVLMVLGKVEREVGKAVEAEKHLTQAKKLTKTPIPSLHWELAQTYADLKKYREAAEELETFIKVGKLSPDEEKNVRVAIDGLKAKLKPAGS